MSWGEGGSAAVGCVSPWRRHGHRGQAGQCQKKIVGRVEEIDVGIARAFGGGYKDGRPVGMVDGDVGGEAGSSAGFLDNVGWRVRAEKVHPAEAYCGRPAGVAQAILTHKIRRKQIDGLGRGVLKRDRLRSAGRAIGN